MQGAEVTKNIAEIVCTDLHAVGYETLFIQENELYDITNASNEYGADLFVSIHCNAALAKSARGTETLDYGGNRRLGLGVATDQKIPALISGLSSVKQLSAGRGHTICVLNDGTVRMWGHNNVGQLGIGTDTNQYRPVTTYSLTNVKQVAAGENHTMCVLNDGTVKVWGSNKDGGSPATFQGQLGTGRSINQYKSPVTLPNLNNVKQINAGVYNSMCLLNDGLVKIWGGAVEYLGCNAEGGCDIPTTSPI